MPAARGEMPVMLNADRANDIRTAVNFAKEMHLKPIIVGGGVAQSGRVLFQPLRRHVRERLSPFFAKRLHVVPAALGEDAGLIGAAVLALRAQGCL